MSGSSERDVQALSHLLGLTHVRLLCTHTTLHQQRHTRCTCSLHVQLSGWLADVTVHFQCHMVGNF